RLSRGPRGDHRHSGQLSLGCRAMNLAPIAERLRAQVPALKLVAGAADFLAAEGRLTIDPAAFVLPVAEAAGPNRLSVGAVRQPLTFTFGVVLALKTPGAASERQLDALTPLRLAVRRALVGWSHP